MKKTVSTVVLTALTLVFALAAAVHAETYKQTVIDRDEPCPMMGGMMDDDCPMMGGGHDGCMMMLPGVNVDMKKTDTGVVVTYSSDDKATVRELQIMAEMMKLKQELGKLHKEKRSSVKEERKDRKRDRIRDPHSHDKNNADDDSDKNKR